MAGCRTAWGLLAALAAGLSAACAPAAPRVVAPIGFPSPTPVTALPSPSLTSAATPAATSTRLPEPTPAVQQPSVTPAPPLQLCAPLEGIALAEMGQPDLLKNPFQAPRPGMDDGHFGADFAFWSRGKYTAMLGLPVYSVLSGKVASVVLNRQPYGNAVIIETPLDALPQHWLEALQAPTPAPTAVIAPSLSCPADTHRYEISAGRSLYLLYAHLNQAPLVKIGQPVTCGQALGEVGTTGRSVNPHLHLETRVGPPGMVIAEMAHYDNSATENEQRNYCTWRVSGLFQAFDPMRLLSLQP